jgi:hypothetical protein
MTHSLLFSLISPVCGGFVFNTGIITGSITAEAVGVVCIIE